MKWPVETIDVVAQVNPKLAAADRPDLDEIVCFVPMAAVSEEAQSIEAQAERTVLRSCYWVHAVQAR